jgi:hypothetical protein
VRTAVSPVLHAIDPGAAIRELVVGTTINNVVSVASIDLVRSPTGVDAFPSACVNYVVAIVCKNSIDIVLAEDDVGEGATTEHIVSPAPGDGVGPAVGMHDVIATLHLD